MIKVLYDFVSDSFTNDELSFNGFASLALVTDKENILSVIKNIVSDYNYSHSVIAQVKSDDKTLNYCYERILSNRKTIYPMKSSGFLYFKNAELHVEIENKADIELIFKNYGHYGEFNLLIFKKEKESEVQDYLQKDLYVNNNRTIKDYLNIFDLIISQSGDEDEVEILYRKKDFDTIQDLITAFVKDYVIGNLK